VVCFDVQVTLVSLASLNCSPLLLETSPVGAEDDDSGELLDVPSAGSDSVELLDCGKELSELLGSRDELDSGTGSLMLMGCGSSSPQLAQKNPVIIKMNFLMKDLYFMVASEC
jgi:hypothetical protein